MLIRDERMFVGMNASVHKERETDIDLTSLAWRWTVECVN
jgi:hypothetical protein